MSRKEPISPEAYAIVLGLRLIASEIALLRRDMNRNADGDPRPEPAEPEPEFDP
jgi:hypothetical protein